MKQAISRSRATGFNVAGLMLAAAGIALERSAGSTLYPTLTGPIVLVVTAALVALRPARWTAHAGVVIPLILGAGLIVSTAMSSTFLDQLRNVGNAGTFAGSILHVLGLIGAVCGGMGRVLLRAGSDRTGEAEP